MTCTRVLIFQMIKCGSQKFGALHLACVCRGAGAETEEK